MMNMKTFEAMFECAVLLEMKSLASQGGEELCHVEHGLTGRSLGTLIECLAVMAFIPGGVTFLEMHFEQRAE